MSSDQKDMLGTSGEDNLGLVIDFANKLRSGAIAPTRAKQFLRGESIYVVLPGSLPVWSITIGGTPPAELLKQLEQDGYFVRGWAKDIMSKSAFTTLPEQQTINLVRATVGDLGFTSSPTTTELWARIKQVGALCPAEAGPHARLQFPDQEKGDVFWVAMEPISDSDGDLHVFRVERGDGGKRWLDGIYANPGSRWGLGGVVVFVLASSPLAFEPGA